MGDRHDVQQVRANGDLEALFTPFSLGSLALRQPVRHGADDDGFSPCGVPGDDVATYCRRPAEAGIGLIVTEGIGVDHPVAIGSGIMGDGDIPHLHGDERSGLDAGSSLASMRPGA